MKILCYSDTHWRSYTEFSKAADIEGTEYLRAIYKSYEWLADHIREIDPDLVVDCGDNAYTIGFLDSMTITWMAKGFALIDDVTKLGHMMFRRLVGNHDSVMLPGYTSSVGFATNLVIKPELIGDFLFLPYTKDLQAIQAIIDSSSPKIVFSHIDILGSRFSSEKASPEGLNASRFSTLFVNGHYHDPHRLGNTYNIGSLMYSSFKDSITDIRRGFFYYNTDIEFIKFFPNPHTPLFHTLDHPATHEIEDFLNYLKDDAKRTYIRLTVNPDVEEKARLLAKEFAGARIWVDKPKPKILIAKSEPLKQEKGWDSVVKSLPDHLREKVRELLQKNAEAQDFDLGVDIKFESLRIKNFMSIGDAYLEFADSGFAVVEGVNYDSFSSNSNGSGKSALWEALYWALTGDTLRGVKVDDVVRIGCTSCVVSVKFSRALNNYEVTRYRGVENKIVLIENGNTRTARTPTETSKRVLRAVGIPPAVLPSLVILSGLKASTTAFSVMTPGERARFVESISGVHIYRLAREDAGKLRKTAKDSIFTLTSTLEASIIIFNKIKNDVDEAEKNLSADIEALEQKKAQLREEFLKASTTLLDLATMQERHEKSIEVLTIDKNVLEENIASTRQRLIALVEKRGGLEAQRDQLNTSLHMDICPTCGQPVTDTKKAEISELLITSKSILAEVYGSIELVEKAQKSYETDLKPIATEIAMTQQFHSRTIEQMRSIENTRDNLNKQMLEIGESIKKISSQIEQRRKEVIALEKQLDTTRVKIDEQKAQEALYDEVYDTLDALRVKAYNETIQEINHYLPTYCDILSSGEFVAEIASFNEAGDDKITFKVNGSEDAYLRLSSGQRARVDRAEQFARTNLVRCNILIADEVDSNLDTSGTERLTDLLELISKDRQVFLTTHNPRMGTTIGKTLMVELRNGVTKVEWQTAAQGTLTLHGNGKGMGPQ